MIGSIRHRGLRREFSGFWAVTVLANWISPVMAVRLSQVLDGSAESWLTQQAHYDLAQVPAGQIKLTRLQLA